MFCIKIADTVIGIDNRYGAVKRICKDYLTDEPPVFTVSSDDADLTYELDLADTLGAESDRSPEYLELVSVYRKICEKIHEHGVYMLHASVIEKDGRGFAFSAPSGTGKSTHILLWRRIFGDKVNMINGDKPLIRVVDGVPYAYGTPWCGKEGWQRNAKAPLHALCFLYRAKENKIEKMSKSDAFMRMIGQVYMPNGAEGAEKVVDLVQKTAEAVNFYTLGCNMERTAAELACKEMEK